nr:C-GCAxxG-C-C family protein [Candidatus Njordarchaeum guaymaensis]
MSEASAAKYHMDGYNCAESVLLVFLDKWGQYFRLGVTSSAATAFGGGMGRMGHICGALSGGLIVIGLAVGRTDAKDDEGKQKAYGAARDLLQRFKERWGTLTCRELTQCDLSTPEGLSKYRELKLQETKCGPIIKETARTLKTIIERIKKDS